MTPKRSKELEEILDNLFMQGTLYERDSFRSIDAEKEIDEAITAIEKWAKERYGVRKEG